MIPCPSQRGGELQERGSYRLATRVSSVLNTVLLTQYLKLRFVFISVIHYIFKIWCNGIFFPFIYLRNASKNSFNFAIFLDLNSHRIEEQSIHKYLIKTDYKLRLTYLILSVLWTLVTIYALCNRTVFLRKQFSSDGPSL